MLNNVVGHWAYIRGTYIRRGDLYSGGLYLGGGAYIWNEVRMRWALVHVVGLYTGGLIFGGGGLIFGGLRYWNNDYMWRVSNYWKFRIIDTNIIHSFGEYWYTFVCVINVFIDCSQIWNNALVQIMFTSSQSLRLRTITLRTIYILQNKHTIYFWVCL